MGQQGEYSVTGRVQGGENAILENGVPRSGGWASSEGGPFSGVGPEVPSASLRAGGMANQEKAHSQESSRKTPGHVGRSELSGVAC